MTSHTPSHKRPSEPSPLALVLGIAGLVAFTFAYTLLLGDIIFFADLARFVGLTVAALCGGAWAVIMWRSFSEYREATRTGVDADFRAHIWLISTSFVGFLVSATMRAISAAGEPLVFRGTPTLMIFGPMALYALWLFLRRGRTATTTSDGTYDGD